MYIVWLRVPVFAQEQNQGTTFFVADFLSFSCAHTAAVALFYWLFAICISRLNSVATYCRRSRPQNAVLPTVQRNPKAREESGFWVVG